METQKRWKKNFFIIAAGQTVSLVGSSAVQFALIWWLASGTSSPMVMAFAGLVAFIPQIVLGPFAGVWIDRMRRKYVVIGADMFIGLSALLFAGVFWFGEPPFLSVCLVLGIRAVGNVFHTPAIQAVIPMLVPREELVRANGFSQFLQSGAFMLGPVLGAAMYGIMPMSALLLTDFVGAVAASVTMLVVRVPEPEKQGARYPDFRKEFKEGIEVFRRDRKLFVLLLAATLCMVFYAPLSSLYPLMTSSYFKATAYHASVVEFLYAGGMMGSALLVGLFGKIKNKLLMAYLGLMGIGVTSLVCGLLPPEMWAFWVFAFVCMLMGGSGNFYSIPCMAYLQENVPVEAQGRAFSLMGSAMSLTMPVGLLISGPVAEKSGVAGWFFITGAAVIIIAGVGLAAERKAEI